MQTVSFAGSSYNIPNTRGDRPWSGLSDFVIAAASKAINTAGGNFTLLADINFGATFGLVSTYYKSRTANVASAGQIRLANADTIKFRNTLNNGDLSVAISSNRLTFEGSRLIIASAAEIVNADISASAAIAVSKLAALTASRAVATDGSGFLVAATTTATELGYVSGVTSAIQTQLNAKGVGTVTSVTGTANQITSTGGATPVLAIASPLTLPGAVTAGGAIAMGTNKITGLGNGTAAQDAAAFGQIPAFATPVTATFTTGSSTTSSTFTAVTNASAAITPVSASHRVKVSFHFYAVAAAGGAAYTVKRGATELSGTTNGFVLSVTASDLGYSICIIDAPASTSALTYQLFQRSLNNVTSINVGTATVTSTIILEEIV